MDKFVDISKVLATRESEDQAEVINYLSGFDFRFNQISVLFSPGTPGFSFS